MFFLLFTAAAAIAGCLLIGLALKAVFWLVLFPVRLVFRIVFGALGLLLGALALPVLIVAGLLVGAVAVVAGLIALLLPLVPFVLLALVGWAIYKSAGRTSPAV
jgi:hypothetical protein